MPYTIARPAGLKSDEPKSPLVLAGEDVMTSGEISRRLVAKVMAYAAFDADAEGKVIEIAESGSFTGDDPTEGKTARSIPIPTRGSRDGSFGDSVTATVNGEGM